MRQWLWLCLTLLSVLPLWLRSLGTPSGEPFADDFFFLRRALLEGAGSWWDGGGSPVFWRPLGRQAYFALVGSTMVEHPWVVVALHLVLLAIASAAIYRALLPSYGASSASLAAGFPWLIDSGRMLIAWPSHFQDVGAIVFAVLACELAGRHRWWAALGMLLGALLCKEIALAAGCLLPWTPGALTTRASRLRAAGGVLLIALLWALAYRFAVVTHGVGFEHQAHAAGTVLPPLLERAVWAIRNSLTGCFSLAVGAGRTGRSVAIGVTTAALASLIVLGRSPAARERLRARRPWILWGAAWFVLSSLTLAETYPSWSAQRCVFGSIGLGIGLVGLLGAVHRSLPIGLLLVRLATFMLAPAPSTAISAVPPAAEEFDYRHFVRLESIVRQARETLKERFPALPPGAIVGQHGMPLMSEHAFAGSRALQVWYRDSTLRWTRWDQFDPQDQRVVGFVEYQIQGDPSFAIVETSAVRELLKGLSALRVAHWADARSALAAAEEQQRDPNALLFLGIVASKRAVVEIADDRPREAERYARLGLERWLENPDSRFVLGQVLWTQGSKPEALAMLTEQLVRFPQDRTTRDLLNRYRAELGMTR